MTSKGPGDGGNLGGLAGAAVRRISFPPEGPDCSIVLSQINIEVNLVSEMK